RRQSEIVTRDRLARGPIFFRNRWMDQCNVKPAFVGVRHWTTFGSQDFGQEMVRASQSEPRIVARGRLNFRPFQQKSITFGFVELMNMEILQPLAPAFQRGFGSILVAIKVYSALVFGTEQDLKLFGPASPLG